MPETRCAAPVRSIKPWWGEKSGKGRSISMVKKQIVEHFQNIPTTLNSRDHLKAALPMRTNAKYLPWYAWYAFALEAMPPQQADTVNAAAPADALAVARQHATRTLLGYEGTWDSLESQVGLSGQGNRLTKIRQLSLTDRIQAARPLVVIMATQGSRPYPFPLPSDGEFDNEITRLTTWMITGRAGECPPNADLRSALPCCFSPLIGALTLHAHLYREAIGQGEPGTTAQAWERLLPGEIVRRTCLILYALKRHNQAFPVALYRVHQAVMTLGRFMDVSPAHYVGALPYLPRDHIPDLWKKETISSDDEADHFRRMLDFLHDARCQSGRETEGPDPSEATQAFQKVMAELQNQEQQHLHGIEDYFTQYHPWFVKRGLFGEPITPSTVEPGESGLPEATGQ